jgi:hypothetical protein
MVDLSLEVFSIKIEKLKWTPAKQVSFVENKKKM